MHVWNASSKALALCLAVGCVLMGGTDGLTALAQKKKKKTEEVAAPAPDPVAIAEAKLSKEMAPVADQLTKMMMKVQGRYLLSPKEAGELVELKYKLLDFLSTYPQSPQLAKPLYQAGVLFTQREEYNDAYEMFHYLTQSFSLTQYGAKAKGQIQQLEKRFGANYFTVEAAVAPEAPTTASAATPVAGSATSVTPSKPAPKK